MIDKFKQYIDTAERILITSHISPDPDATASVLLLGTTLQLNFPDKKIRMVLEEKPEGLDFLNGYDQLIFSNITQNIEQFKPDLIILVDANSFERCSRHDGQQAREYALKNRVKTAIIDHHEPDGKDKVDCYLNSGNPATVQEVYELCFNEMNLKKPQGYAVTTMLGLYADTGGFTYDNPRYAQTFKLAAELIAAGAVIEEIKNHLNQYSGDQMKVISELANNVTGEAGYSYSFINDEFVENWQRSGKPLASLHMATKPFLDEYIRNIDGRKWGFLVYLDLLDGEHTYSVSLRSLGGVKDVSKIATKFSGGGHRPAAGGKVQANNVEEAIEKVKAAIKSES
ncbi:MAG: DHH family phosphoesterase [Candidatus Saccharimonadales bacterium]|jgi:phosphoesterase RecJ-like protein